MNELPIGSLCLHKDFWNRHVANISSTANTHQRAGREWDPVDLHEDGLKYHFAW